jgi:hypothetical protein
MSSSPLPISDTQLLQQATTSLIKLILEENSFNGHVILLLTPRTLNRLFGGKEAADQILAATVRRWKAVTRVYGKTEAYDCLNLETCLPIAVLQSVIGFQDSKDVSTNEEDLTLGQSFARIWGETSYQSGVGQRYFNPSESSVDDANSFQYRLWLFLKDHFESHHQLHLDVPAPQAYRGRFLRFVKYQVHLTHHDIREVSALLNTSIDFLNSPSPETIHHLLFSKWKEVESTFAPRLREVISASGNDGQLERFYSNIIARYFDASAERVSGSEEPRKSSAGSSASGNPQQLRLEFVKGTISLYLYNFWEQTFSDFSSRETFRQFFRNDKSHLLIFHEEDPENLYQEFALCGSLIPDDRKLVVLAFPELHPIIKLSESEWQTAFVLGQKINYQVFHSASQLPAAALVGRNVIPRTSALPSGGLKHPGTRKTYLVNAGPRISPGFPIRQVGFSPINDYNPNQLSPGRYLTPHNRFDVAHVSPAIVDTSPFGFSLSSWSYTSDIDKINLTGLAVTNPIPMPLTRRWVEKQLLARQSVKLENLRITP